jgi:hypothetical protein
MKTASSSNKPLGFALEEVRKKAFLALPQLITPSISTAKLPRSTVPLES